MVDSALATIFSTASEIIEIQETEAFYDYFDRLGKRFKKAVWSMYSMIDEGKKLIPDTHLVFHDFAVEYQNDLGSVTLPGRNCMIITMAAQVNYNDFYEVHIDERLFNHPKHSRQSQASLILHELVYGLGRKFFNHKDSGATRNIVRYFISYHDSITDGGVSRALHDLNFSLKEEGMPRDYNLYRQSEIMQILDEALEYEHETVKNTLDYNTDVMLFIDVVNQYEVQGMDSANYERNLLGLKKLLENALYNAPDKTPFLALQTRFETNLASLKSIIEGAFQIQIENLTKRLKEETIISEDNLELAKKHIENYLDPYSFLGDLDWYFKYIIGERNEIKNILDEVYGFLSVESVCRVTTQPMPMPTPTPQDPNQDDDMSDDDDSEQECFGPLKLNHVIPKINL